MRVIAGFHRGTPLRAPSGHTTRPITDRAKESLFSILEHRFGAAGEFPLIDVLDLFAGSGALGIECLSRGARSCVFVERDRMALQALRDNLVKTRLESRARIARGNAWNLRICSPEADDGAAATADDFSPGYAANQFGLIFVDPPYEQAENVVRLFDLLTRVAVLLTAGGIIVLRFGQGTQWPPDSPASLRQVDQRRFRDMNVVLFERDGAGP